MFPCSYGKLPIIKDNIINKEKKLPKIYFIQSIHGGPIKIGLTNEIKTRLHSIQTMSPVKLKVIATIEGDYLTEKALHQIFSKYRLYGEWFDPCPEIMEFINNRRGESNNG